MDARIFIEKSSTIPTLLNQSNKNKFHLPITTKKSLILDAILK